MFTCTATLTLGIAYGLLAPLVVSVFWLIHQSTVHKEFVEPIVSSNMLLPTIFPI